MMVSSRGVTRGTSSCQWKGRRMKTLRREVTRCRGSLITPQTAPPVRDEDVPVIAGAVAPRVQRDLGDGIVAVERIDGEEDARGVPRQHGEVHPVGNGRDAQRQTPPARDPQVQHGYPTRMRETNNSPRI